MANGLRVWTPAHLFYFPFNDIEISWSHKHTIPTIDHRRCQSSFVVLLFSIFSSTWRGSRGRSTDFPSTLWIYTLDCSSMVVFLRYAVSAKPTCLMISIVTIFYTKKEFERHEMAAINLQFFFDLSHASPLAVSSISQIKPVLLPSSLVSASRYIFLLVYPALLGASCFIRRALAVVRKRLLACSSHVTSSGGTNAGRMKELRLSCFTIDFSREAVCSVLVLGHLSPEHCRQNGGHYLPCWFSLFFPFIALNVFCFVLCSSSSR